MYVLYRGFPNNLAENRKQILSCYHGWFILLTTDDKRLPLWLANRGYFPPYITCSRGLYQLGCPLHALRMFQHNSVFCYSLVVVFFCVFSHLLREIRLNLLIPIFIANCMCFIYRTVLYTALHGAVVLHCTALHCTALHCTALHCTALHCTALHCTALHCTALHVYSTVLHVYCTVLYSTLLYCTVYCILYTVYCILYTVYCVLYCTVLYCTVLYCTVLRCAVHT